MTTDEHSTPEHPTAREKLLQKEETQRTPNIRNSIDGSSISNAIQADQIHGGVHFYSADLRDHLYREEAPAAQAANGQPELETGGNKPRNAFVEYFTRIWKARSPILIWGATMLSLDVAVVGFLEYILGGQRPEEPASEDLNTAQAGSFFLSFFSLLLLWRHAARRSNPEKWPSLSDVHPSAVQFLRSRIAAVIILTGAVLLIALLTPGLMDPNALTAPSNPQPQGTPNAPTISSFGYRILNILALLEISGLIIYVNRSYGRRPTQL